MLSMALARIVSSTSRQDTKRRKKGNLAIICQRRILTFLAKRWKTDGVNFMAMNGGVIPMLNFSTRFFGVQHCTPK